MGWFEALKNILSPASNESSQSTTRTNQYPGFILCETDEAGESRLKVVNAPPTRFPGIVCFPSKELGLKFQSRIPGAAGDLLESVNKAEFVEMCRVAKEQGIDFVHIIVGVENGNITTLTEGVVTYTGRA